MKRHAPFRVLIAGLVSVAVLGLVATQSPGGPKKAAREGAKAKQRTSNPTSRPHPGFGEVPAAIDQTIEKQNSPQDKLRVDVTHSQASGGKFVSYVRVVWGDLDNLIKKNGKEFYSDWDGKLAIEAGAGKVVHQIAFEGGKKQVTTKPAAAAGKKAPTTKSVERQKTNKVRHLVLNGEGPGPGSGRDELDVASGKTIIWQAGVVGAFDGLLIQITSDKADVTATLTAGKFTVPVKITGQ